LIAIQQIGIVAKVSKKPMELPQGSLGAIQPTEKGPVFRGLRLQNDKSDLYEGFVGMSTIPSSFHAN
jgi:hypothetical protein